MGIMKRLFGGAEIPEPPSATPSRLPADAASMETDPQATTRRELVRMLTRDTLRFSGIPDAWVESQFLLELGRGGQAHVHLRLVVKHWDERLLRYVVAFQRRLRSEIVRFEPGAREWLLSITWQYDLDDQCPDVLMPDPKSWAEVDTAGGAVSKEEADMQADLARLFAVRDADLASPSPASGSAHGERRP